jgi:hypothetical protein
MGCCNSASYPEIDDASSIEQLITALENKKAFSLETIQKYEKALSAKTNPLDDDSRTTLTNRIEYLNKYNNYCDSFIDILKENKGMDFLNTQAQLHAFFDCFKLEQDNNGYLELINNNLIKITKNDLS